MRRLIYLSALFIIIYSQQTFAQKILDGAKGLQPEMIDFGNEPISFNPNTVVLGGKNGLAFSNELKVVSAEKDKLGMEHFRYQQTHKGILVENAFYIAHTKDSKLFSQNGVWVRDFPANLPRTTKINHGKALEIAKRSVGASLYKWEVAEEEAHLKVETNNPSASYRPSYELVYYANGEGLDPAKLRLAYKLDIYSQLPLSRQVIYVDATDGTILGKEEIIHHANVQGTATTAYSGQKNISTDFNGTNYSLRSTSRGINIETYNMKTAGRNFAAAVDFVDDDNNWTNANTNLDQYATDAHWGAEMTYDFWLTKFGRNSYNNAGAPMRSYVHAQLSQWGYPTNANAFWDGYRVTYGDGDGYFRPYTALDICGHEFTHGMITNTAALNYSYEPGALNEGFSDIFGTAIEFFARPERANWTIGEDLRRPLRSMSNPKNIAQPNTYGGTYWYTGANNNGGVHTNSGVLNYWFYLLAVGANGTNDVGTTYNVVGIGLDKAVEIAYRTLTVYLTSTSNFQSARFYSIKAAEDLYGVNSTEALTVGCAWGAVNVGSCITTEQLAMAPANLRYENLTTNSIKLLWSPVANADSYNVAYKLESQNVWTTVATSLTDTTIAVDGLYPFMKYDWKVVSNFDSTQSIPSYAKFTTIEECEAPSDLYVQSTSTTGALVGWSCNTYISFILEYKKESSNVWMVAGNSLSDRFYTFTNLEPNTKYDFRVANRCYSRYSDYAYANFTTVESCEAPTGLAASPVTSNYAALSWNYVGGASSYKVSYRSVDSNEWIVIADATYNNHVQISGLSPFTRYEWRVSSNCTTTTSAFATSSFLTLEVCNAPVGLTASYIETTSAKLDWSSVAYGVSYKLEYKPSASSDWIVASAASSNNTFQLNNLQSYTTYNWRVTTNCTTLASSATESVFTTLEVCNAPSDLSSSNITTSSATLNWAGVLGANNYKVEYKKANEIEWQLLETATNTTSSTINNLQPLTQYFWRVGTNCSSISSNATVASFTTLELCQVPASVSTTAISSNGAMLNWSAVSGAVSYKVEYKAMSDATWRLATAATSATSFLLTGIEAATTYAWQVTTNCTSTSSESASSIFTTLQAIAPCVNAFEPNETLASAALIALGTPISAAIATNGDVDFFKVTTTTSSHNSFVLNVPSGANLNLYVYNSSGTLLGSATTANATETVNLSSQAAGVYYVKVMGATGSFTNNCYTFTATAEPIYDSEPNNTASAAILIPLNTDVKGYISTSSDVDFYKFIITTPGTATITLNNLPADYDIKLYSSNGSTLMASSSNYGTTGETISRTFTAGTYYLRVNGSLFNYSTSKNYVLRVSTGTASIMANEMTEQTFEVKPDIVVYPNPVVAHLHISTKGLDMHHPAKVQVIDLKGKVVMQEHMHTEKLSLNVSKLAVGMYFLRVVGQHNISTQKFIKN